MKGFVFTCFLDLVEDNFGYEIVDEIILTSNLSTGGVYTSIGTYPHYEIFELVGQLSSVTQIPIRTLLKLYGQHFFKVSETQYGYLLSSFTNTFQLLESIPHYMHIEVKKIYPDAELPQITTKRVADNVLEMIYSSEQKMFDFAEGLIDSCLKFYGEEGSIEQINLNDECSKVRFLITKRNER